MMDVVEDAMLSNSNISKSMAVMVCAAMTVLYVATLHSPTLILRLPQATSYKQFMIRRFYCAFISSILSLLVSSLILFPRSWKLSHLLAIYGVRDDHIWRAVVFPFSLTSVMYAGSLVRKCISSLDSRCGADNEGFSLNYVHAAFHKIGDTMISISSDISAWRNLVVAPITEELVFRACMIPLLLCGGFKPQTVVFLCPVFFSLAHLNHLLEFYARKNYSLVKTSMAVGREWVGCGTDETFIWSTNIYINDMPICLLGKLTKDQTAPDQVNAWKQS